MTTRFPVDTGQTFDNNGDSTVAEQQIAAVQDDNSSEGVIRTRLVSGELVMVPPNTIDRSSALAGAATLTFINGFYSNRDGTGSTLSLGTATGTIGTDMASAFFVFYGRVFGMRWRRQNPVPVAGVIIDGIAYKIPDQQLSNYNNNAQNTSIEGYCNSIIAENLEDRAHTVRIILQPTGVASVTFPIYGFLLEKRAGYFHRDPMDSIIAQSTLTTSFASLSPSDANAQPNRGYRKMVYYNSDASSRIVTVQYNSIVVWSKTIIAGDTAVFDISLTGINIGNSPINIQHKADSAGVVLFTGIGSM